MFLQRLPIATRGLAWFALAALASAQASHDACVHARLLRIGAQPGSTLAATLVPLDAAPSCASTPTGPDVWYAYRPEQSGTLAVTVCSTAMDPLLAIVDGCPDTPHSELACNEDALSATCLLPGTASASAQVEAGSLYLVRVAGENGASGDFTLFAAGPQGLPPINDEQELAIAIAPGTRQVENVYATGASNCGGQDVIWFTYVPAQTGPASVDTCAAADHDTVLVVKQGPNLMTCGDNECGLRSRADWLAVAGDEYRIGYGGFVPGAEGSATLTLAGPPSANDVCEGALELALGRHALSLDGASADGASSCDAGSEPDLFYTYTAAADGRLTVTTCGTDAQFVPGGGEDALLSLHAGCPASAANARACSDNAPSCDGWGTTDAHVELDMLQGETIVIRVSRAVPPPPLGTGQPVLLDLAFAPGVDSFCAGDGAAAACPCANHGAAEHGCANSQVPEGARLGFSGATQLSNDTLTLLGSEMPATTTVIYLQGSITIPAQAFGDGLRCIGGSLLRLGVRFNVDGASSFGYADGSGQLVSLAGQVPALGGARFYQVWYRDSASFCTSASFNISNAFELTWTP